MGDGACYRLMPSQYEPLNNAEWLSRVITDQSWTVPDIASAVGCDTSTVRRWLDEHGIDERVGRWQDDESQSEPTVVDQKPLYAQQWWQDEQQLRRAYETYLWSVMEIADWIGVSHRTLLNRMDGMGIERRSPGLSKRITHLKRQGYDPDDIRDMVRELGDGAADSPSDPWGSNGKNSDAADDTDVSWSDIE